MILKFSKTFTKQRNKAPANIQKALDNKIELFIKDYKHPKLNLHKLHGVLKDYYSINITGDYRAVLKFINEKEVVIFLMIGNHNQLYK